MKLTKKIDEKINEIKLTYLEVLVEMKSELQNRCYGIVLGSLLSTGFINLYVSYKILILLTLVEIVIIVVILLSIHNKIKISNPSFPVVLTPYVCSAFAFKAVILYFCYGECVGNLSSCVSFNFIHHLFWLFISFTRSIYLIKVLNSKWFKTKTEFEKLLEECEKMKREAEAYEKKLENYVLPPERMPNQLCICNEEDDNTDEYIETHQDKSRYRKNINMSLLQPLLETQPANTINAVGIDLGTTQCCAATNRKSGIETFPLDDIIGRLLPSYVSYDEQNVKCGQIVVNRLQYFAKSTVFDIKRIIGKKFENISIDNSWPFAVTEVESKVNVRVKTRDQEILKLREQISADLLKHIKQKAEEFQGRKLTDVVITVPAAFDNEQKNSTKIAALMAGWETVHLLSEPVAAAFAHFIDRPIPIDCTILLFDLGGGTLDVCIFKIFSGKFEIISRSGDSHLGGRDFDALLIEYFTDQLKTQFGVEVIENKKYKLVQECQTIKHNLTERQDDQLYVEDFDQSKLDCYVTITREQFEFLSNNILNKIQNNIHTTLKNINKNPDQMNKVLYVGGGCRMPMIQQLLHSIFPQAEHAREQFPDEVVAIGAAHFAYHLQAAGYQFEEQCFSILSKHNDKKKAL